MGSENNGGRQVSRFPMKKAKPVPAPKLPELVWFEGALITKTLADELASKLMAHREAVNGRQKAT